MLDINTAKYVGEEQLAQLAADAKTTADTAQSNADNAAPDEVAAAKAKADAAPA